MRKTFVTAMVCVGLLAAPLSAQDFFATNNLSAGNFGTVGDELIRYDFSTAAWVSIGDTQIPGLAGLDWSSTARTTLIASTGFGARAPEMFSISTTTGAATSIGFAPVPMSDLALNRSNGKMYGTAGGTLYRDDNGDSIPETNIGTYPGNLLEVGLGFDAQGNVYVHDLIADQILKGIGANAASVTLLYDIGYNSNFSQGLYVGDERGYHGALDGGALTSPNYSFDLNGADYTLQSTFATHTNGLPEVEVGDLTIVPEPASAMLLILGIGVSAVARRRR